MSRQDYIRSNQGLRLKQLKHLVQYQLTGKFKSEHKTRSATSNREYLPLRDGGFLLGRKSNSMKPTFTAAFP